METMEEIKAIRVEIKEIYEKLTKKKGEVYNNYLEYVDKNKKNNFFGLDSLHFQNKLFELEYESLTKQYNFIDNRIYCDFYKLFGLITQFLKKNYKDNFDNLLKNKNYPIYKDLEQYKVYDFNTVNDIHHDIIVLIKYLFEKVDSVKNEIEDDTEKMSTGLNIANYIYNFIFSNSVTESNVKLFEDYLKSYHSYHKTVLNNLKEKFVLMLKQLDPPGPNPDDFEIVSENKVVDISDVPKVEVVESHVPEIVSEVELIEPVKVVEQVEIIVPELIEPVVSEVVEPGISKVEIIIPEVIETLKIVEVVEVVEPVKVVEVIEPVVSEPFDTVVSEPFDTVVPKVIEPVDTVVPEVIEPVKVVEIVETIPEQIIVPQTVQNPLHNYKMINVIDYIKESTPSEVKNHIINSFKENDSTDSTIIQIKNPNEDTKVNKEKKKKKR